MYTYVTCVAHSPNTKLVTKAVVVAAPRNRRMAKNKLMSLVTMVVRVAI